MMEEESKSSSFFWKQVLLNKYLIVGLGFAVWMIFFDQNSFLHHRELQEEIKTLEKEKAYYKSEYERIDSLYHKLKNDPEEAERIAREKYLMKKKSEDLFVIEIEKSNEPDQ